MSDHKHGLDLPSPRSPQALDEQILSYARQRTPQRSYRPYWATGGLASAAVLVVAVIVSTGEPGAPEESLLPAVLVEQEAAEAPTSDAEASPAAALRHDALQAPELSLEERDVQFAADVSTPAPSVLNSAAKAVESPDYSAARLPRAAAKQARAYSGLTDEQSEHTSELLAEQAAAAAAIAAPTLEDIRELLSVGDTAAATAALDIWREYCSDCAVPEDIQHLLIPPPESESATPPPPPPR